MKNKKIVLLILVFTLFGGLSLGSGSSDSSSTSSSSESKQESSEDSETDSELDSLAEEVGEAVSDAVEEAKGNELPAEWDLATQNAYKSAKNYLSFMAFSKQGLIDQLSSEYGDGYTVEQATAAVQFMEDSNEVDWNEQAVKSAQNYLENMAFSRQGLIDQLSSDYGSKFTVEQATYAVDQVGL